MNIPAPHAPSTTVLAIDGMSCDHCVRHVHDALSALDGVRTVTVDLPRGRARIEHDPTRATVPTLVTAVADAGYDATPAAD